MADLNEALAGWAPQPHETDELIHAWPAAAFSALLELPEPAAREGDPLPTLWHWFHFLETLPQSALGDDGHPAQGRFLPPVPDRRRMIAGGRVVVVEPLVVGERVTRRCELVAVKVKDGRTGPMVFVTTRYELRRDGHLLVTEEQDVVYRSQPPGAPRGLLAGSVDLEPDHDFRLKTPTSPELLFRMSALTYNTHRIHYDQPYVTAVEGYPGLVVHGPLLALLLLEIPRRYTDREVKTFDYRLTNPVFSGSTILTHGRLDRPDRISLSGMVEGGQVAITGSAHLS